MSDTVKNFESQHCRAHIKCFNNHDVTIEGVIHDNVKDDTIYYIAAAPADHRATFTGSGLPFQNQVQAFDNTPNSGKIKLGFSKQFKIDLAFPNAYQTGLGSVTIPPTLYVMYINNNNQSRTVAIKISDGIPYRMLTYPMKRSGPQFYDTQFKLFPMSQWKQLVLSGYPSKNEMEPDFWGHKPPL